MRYFILCLLPFLSIFLQSTFFSIYSIKDAIPDLVLIFVVFHALTQGKKRGAIYGFLCGLFEDLYLGRFIGINALSKGITAYIIGSFRVHVFRENLLVGIFAVLTGTLLNSLLMFMLAWIYFNVFHIDIAIIRNFAYQSIYNMILSAPIYVWYYRSSHRGLLQVPEGDR